MKYLGFNHGQFGDLVMNLVPCKVLKTIDSSAHITLCVSEKFSSIVPLFYHNQYIDDFLITEGYCSLSKRDVDCILSKNFDCIYFPWQDHRDPFWFEKRHQLKETCLMHKLPSPACIKYKLNPWFMPKEFLVDKNKIVLAPFGGGNMSKNKSLSFDRAIRLVDFLKQFGFQVYQVGASNDTKLPNCIHVFDSWIDSVKEILTSLCVISVDTAISWVTAGYNHPIIGLYGIWDWKNPNNIVNILPPNDNAEYIITDRVDNISFETIESKIQIWAH